MGRIRFLILPLLLLSCGPRVPAGIVVPLQDEPRLGVRLAFNDTSAWFMFDTGAGAHTFARWFVDAAGMETAENSVPIVARDATGAPVELRVLRRLSGFLPDGRELVLESAVVGEFPPGFEEADLGGLLNPQLLANEDQLVVLDLRIPELRIESAGGAGNSLGGRWIDETAVEVCTDADAPVDNLVYAVSVSTGHRQGFLQLDTGAGTTVIREASALVEGRPLETAGETMGIAGTQQPYSIARDLPLEFGGHAVVVDAHVVRRTHGGCGPDGLLGRDALENCVLVFGNGSLAIACGA